MLNTQHIEEMRSILFSARVQFSPETQPMKECAIDNIIQQNLLLAERDIGFTLQEIEESINLVCGKSLHLFRSSDVQDSLSRLIRSHRISKRSDRFSLSKEVYDEFWSIQNSVERRIIRTLDKLFKYYDVNIANYREPFLNTLCCIFSFLGYAYVETIRTGKAQQPLSTKEKINDCIKEILYQRTDIDAKLLKKALIRFFEQSDPDFDYMKWNLAQNYYILKAIGADPTGFILSKEVIGDSVLYLDTNVLIQALEPQARHHRIFLSLSKACKNLNIRLCACQISLNELKRVVDYYISILPRVIEQVPIETRQKVRNIFFKLYIQAIEESNQIELNELFEQFVNPKETIKDMYSIEIVDDPWFVEVEKSPQTTRNVHRIIDKYTHERVHIKGKLSALHDVLLLQLIKKMRNEDQRAYFLTLDTLLPSYVMDEEMPSQQPFAITLDALLQWVSPWAMSSDAEKNFTSIYSEALKYQLLPQENIFEVNDFLMLADMEWDCKQLPAEDVEDCIYYLKSKARGLDLTKSQNRETIAHEIAKFFADPSRKYKKEMDRLKQELSETKAKSKEEIDQLKEHLNRTQEIVDRLQTRIEQDEKHIQERRIKRSAWLRFSLVLTGIAVYEAVVVYLSFKFGAGTNVFQKISSSWHFLTFGGLLILFT